MCKLGHGKQTNVTQTYQRRVSRGRAQSRRMLCGQVKFISPKARRQETAIRPCGHLGQRHVLAILNSCRYQLKLVIEQKIIIIIIQNIINKMTLTVLPALH